MKVSEIKKMLLDPKMQNKNTNLKIIGDRTRKPTIGDVIVSLEQFKLEVRNGFAKINERIDNLEIRIDNLVTKNNLKE